MIKSYPFLQFKAPAIMFGSLSYNISILTTDRGDLGSYNDTIQVSLIQFPEVTPIQIPFNFVIIPEPKYNPPYFAMNLVKSVTIQMNLKS